MTVGKNHLTVQCNKSKGSGAHTQEESHPTQVPVVAGGTQSSKQQCPRKWSHTSTPGSTCAGQDYVPYNKI